jgi:prepilin-type N-terminal cleavage/methylation domain-containing protein
LEIAVKPSARGVTLIEMLIVVTLIGLMAAITFPSVGAGLDGLRLTTASNSISAFLNAGWNRAERRREPVELIVSVESNQIDLRSADQTYTRTLTMPDGVRIERIHPVIPGLDDEKARTTVIYPGGTTPRIGVEIANRRGSRRIVRVDPVTGVPAVEQIQQQ